MNCEQVLLYTSTIMYKVSYVDMGGLKLMTASTPTIPTEAREK